MIPLFFRKSPLPSHTIDEVAGLHAALAVLLELKELELEVLAVDVQVFAVNRPFARSTIGRTGSLLGLVYLESTMLGAPCSWIGTEPTNEVVDSLGRLAPVYLTGVLEYFWRRGRG